ncbi:MAG: thiamine phosphate synthase [Bacteroidia bacterium]
MIVIIVSHPTLLNNEAAHINELFKQGMELFHVRKPDYSGQQMDELLSQIKPEYHRNLVLHQHHQLAEKHGVKRLHFPEQKRKDSREEDLKALKEKGFTLSTSVHSLEEHVLLPDAFSYAFYGPVFESISKPGYKPKENMFPILKKENRAVKLIAIGGVTPDKMMLLNDFGFDGVALLGAVWDQLAKTQKN